MHLYACRLTFHDNLFYETRTLGRLYETGRLLHNIALAYALGLVQTTYFHPDYRPRYTEELAALNEAQVYVMPAGGEDVRYAVNTFKLGGERSSMLMERSNANIPTYGRAKEVSLGSVFTFGILAESMHTFPTWIRMGLWLSKAHLEVGEPIELTLDGNAREDTVRLFPLNPNDLPASCELRVFDLVSMRPTSLVENATIHAEAWWTGHHPNSGRFRLPAGMQFNVQTAKRKS